MKKTLLLLFSVLGLALITYAQNGSVPELMYYKFDGSGTNVSNDASSPVGTNPAVISGAQTQGGVGQFGTGLVGSGGSSTTDFLNTGWAPNLTGSWTISFYTENIQPSTTLYYIMGDNTAGSWRMFTNGVAGANNWMMRGPIPDLVATGAATVAPHVSHFVYDAVAGTVTAYVDGVQSNQVSAPGLTISGTGPFKVGGYSGSTGLAPAGIMDEFRMYNRALTAQEILDTYNQMLPLGGSPDDAGVVSIDSPSNFCPGVYDVYATIRNYGNNQINTVTVNWAINGALQTPIQYTSVLDTFNGLGSQEAQILLGSNNFMPNVPYDIDVWTSMPNNVMDTVNNNDSASATLQGAIAGNLTIGASGADYTNFSSAAAALSSFGICGPVHIDVDPGTYTDFFELTEISGASSVNTITFDGGDRSLVNITHDGSSQNATVWLNGADWVTIKNITVNSTSTSSDSWGILFSNQANHNTIDSCDVILPIATTDDRCGILASSSPANDFGEGNNANFTTISNCNIVGGDRNITFEGAGTGNWTVGNRFINNTLSFADDYGFYGDDQDSLVFQGNTISDLQNATNADGFYCFDFENLTLRENIIEANDWAVYCSDLNVDNIGGRSVIANNFVTSNNDYGMYLIDAENVDIWHNTVFGEPALYLDYSFDGLDSNDVRNNILISNNDYAFEIDLNTGFAGVSALDNNIYNTNGTNFAFWEGQQFSDLPSWQTAFPQYNIGSYEGDPIFFAPGDFHVVGPLANNQGSPTPIDIDLDGDARSATNPDIGADEYSLLPNDAGVFSLDTPGVYCPGTFPVWVTVANFGVNQITSVTVNWSVDGVVQSPATFSGLLDTLGGTGSRFGSVQLGTFNFATNNPYLVEAWVTSTNGGADPNPTNDTLATLAQSSLPPPTNITVQAISGNSATLVWAGGSANSWLWENVPQGNPLVGPGTPVTSASANVTGLSPETDYDFYVREICPTGDTSAWAGPFSYKTPFLCPPNAYCFLTGGVLGQNGPTQADLTPVYNGTPLQGNVTSNNGTQVWTVPASGLYRITAYGAEGGGSDTRPGGKGAMAEGEFLINGGTVLNIVVGQPGNITTGNIPSGNRGGGGGSFVWDAAQPTQPPLIAAGGGGGSNVSVTSATLGVDGSDLPDGTFRGDGNGNPGINGNGATPGGAGFFTGSTNSSSGNEATAIVSGAQGGDGYTATSHYGGFGGGGGGGGSPSTTFASGGGGGYSGGAGQETPASQGGGGGGSYVGGANAVIMAGVRTDQGVVIIEVLSSGATNDIGVVTIDSPTVYCPGVIDVYATINNFGANQVSSATINWSVDGALQTPFSFTGLLDTAGGTGSSSAQINLGPFNFATNNPYDIAVWTSNPNGVTDTVPGNDTLINTVQSNLPPPTGLVVNSVAGNSASISWNPGSLANSWLWTVVAPGNPPTGVGSATSTPTANVTLLTPKTAYDFYVREVCPTGDTSTWAGPLNFQTPFLCPPGSFCFSNCGQDGSTGPDQAQCNTVYNGSPLQGQVTVVNGIQEWTIPSGGVYEIEVSGAQGFGPFGGRGARMKGDFVFSGGETLKIIVGQKGAPPVGSGTNQYGGGGGTFVTDLANNPLIIAGGGGGSWANAYTTITDASTSTTGNSGGGVGATGGTGGTAGQGGLTNISADGGGGLLTDGTGTAGGFAFVNGGNGGIATTSGGEGGFGGGGGASSFNNRRGGGGGGYSGGGGAHGGTTGLPEAGGGGSINNGNNQSNLAGANIEDGSVIIRPLSSGATNDIGIAGVTPNSQLQCSGDFDIVATVLNFGINQINSAQVNWEWNGVIQTPVQITSLIDTFGGTGSSTIDVNLGTRNIVGTNSLKVWTSAPNGSGDTVNVNDTLSTAMNPQFTSAEILSSNSAEICGGGTVTLTATFTGDSLNWYDDPGLTNLVNSGTSYTVTVTNTETYYLRAENFNGCDSRVDTVVAEVNFTPTGLNFANSANGCIVSFTSTLSANVDSVRWAFGDGGTSADPNPVHTYTTGPQTFVVELIAYDGTCSDTVSRGVFVNCNVGLRDADISQKVNIFPNPSNGVFQIEINEISFNTLEILDIKGNVIYREEGQFDLSKRVELNNLSTGKYILRMSGDDGTAVKNLVIE